MLNERLKKIGVIKTKKAIEQNNKFILVLSPDCYSDENRKLIEIALSKIKLKQTIILFNKNDLKDLAMEKKMDKECKAVEKI